MQIVVTLLLAAVFFGLCYLADRFFTGLFRSKAQHRSGLSVRVSKTYGIMGTVLMILGVLALVNPEAGQALTLGGWIVLFMGIALAGYYLGKGIFYNEDSFLVCIPGKKSRTLYYRDILHQQLYLIQGGSVVIELHMADGSAVSLQSTMTGVYPFLDTAFSGWCRANGQDPENCEFHDPSKHWWFPHKEDV